MVDCVAVALAGSGGGTHVNWPEIKHMQINWSRVINDAVYTILDNIQQLTQAHIHTHTHSKYYDSSQTILSFSKKRLS